MTSASLARPRALRLQDLVATTAVAVAVLVGAAMAVNPRIGVALLVGACAVPFVLLDLSLGIALWMALIPVSHLPVLGTASSAVGLLTAGSWLGLRRQNRGRSGDGVEWRGGLTVLVLLLAWISLSLVWTEDTGHAAGELARWYFGALVLGVVVTSLQRPRDARLVVGGFVLGVVLSVLVGLINDGLGGAGAATETLTSTEGRLQGGLGDPNFLAAAIVPAIVLAGALLPSVRATARWALVLCIGLLVVGLMATQSRGGAVAAAGVFLAALFLMPRQRRRVLAAGLGIALVGALYFATYPNAFERITSSAGSGSGRTDIWQVAWRITAQHPAVGVGLHNFTVYSPRYVREPGALNNVDLIAERPHAVHNTYLELLTETGVVGLALFLAMIVASLRAAWQAASMFERRGDQALGTLSRGVLVAGVAVLVTAVFVSLGSHQVIWLLLALGPALLAVAARLPHAITVDPVTRC
jgi:O-antigen ligase